MPSPRSNRHLLVWTLLCVGVLAGCDKSGNKGHTADPPSPDPQTEERELSASEQPEVGSPNAIERPYFWKVEGPQGASGHLLGTMHMGIDATTALPQFVWDAHGAASILAVEADVMDPSLAKAMMLPKGQSLRDILGEETWLLLEKELGAGTAKMLMGMKPAAAASMLALKGLPTTMPMDMALLLKAKAEEIKISYLETAAFQLKMLENIMTADFVTEMLNNPEASDSEKMLAAYRAGDEGELEKLMLDPGAWGKNHEANIEAMLYARNRDWIPKLKPLFAGKNAFVAVGAAHLVGDKSVVELLEKEGYTVTRVTP